MSLPRIGILVVTHENLAYTKQAMPSIRSHHPMDVLVIDDGSKDGTREWLSQNGYSWLPGESKDSLSGRWNMGVDLLLAKEARYVAILNNDIILSPVAIDGLAACLENHKDVFVALGENRRHLNDPTQIPQLQSQVDEEASRQMDDFGCFMLGRECWDVVGKFDEEYKPYFFEDFDYEHRVHLAGKRVIATRLAPMFHYGSRSTSKMPPNTSIINANMRRFISKWGGGACAVWDAIPAIRYSGHSL